MNAEELKKRSKKVGLDVISLIGSLPKTKPAEVIAWQLTPSATGVGANYRAACRAKSRKDFVAKMGTVEAEADESVYWLEMLLDGKIVQKEKVEPLLKEAEELTAIFTASGRTAKHGLRKA